jgi:hypothetical protein
VGLERWRVEYKLASDAVHSSHRGNIFHQQSLFSSGRLIIGPTNFGLGSPGQQAVIALVRCTTVFLVVKPNDWEVLVNLKVLQRLVDITNESFVACHQAVEAHEQQKEAQRTR